VVEPVSDEVAVANEIQGIVKRVAVQEGEEVKAGALIAELVHDDAAARLAAAEAQLGLRRAELEKLLNGARPEERREAAANLRDAEAALSIAQVTLKRRLFLADQGVTPREVLDQIRSTVASAQARRDAAAEKLALVNAPPRDEDVAIARASLQLAEANVQQAKAALDKNFIRAPRSGTILRLFRRSGEAVAQTVPTTIAIVGDIRRLRVRAEIDETDVARIGSGQRAYVTADAYGGQRLTGTVAAIACRMGKKAVHTDDPAERIDAKVLEALIDLDPEVRLPVGLRVDVFVETGASGRAPATGGGCTRVSPPVDSRPPPP
jgi:HlyD family secretion protein